VKVEWFVDTGAEESRRTGHALTVRRLSSVLGRLDIGRQPLCHLDLSGVVHRPRRPLGNGFDGLAGARIPVAGLFDAAEGKLDLCADTRQIRVREPDFGAVSK